MSPFVDLKLQAKQMLDGKAEENLIYYTDL